MKTNLNILLTDSDIFQRGRELPTGSRGLIHYEVLGQDFKNSKIEFGLNLMTGVEGAWVYFQFNYSGKDSWRNPLNLKRFLSFEQLQMSESLWKDEVTELTRTLLLKAQNN